MKKTNKITAVKEKLASLELSLFCENMLRIFLPVIIILFLCVIAYIIERGEDAGSHTYAAASAVLEKIFLSLTILLVGVFVCEYNIRQRK